VNATQITLEMATTVHADIPAIKVRNCVTTTPNAYLLANAGAKTISSEMDTNVKSMFRQPKLCLHRRKKSQQSVLEFVLKIRNA
jgi:hypothetical protein